MLFMLQTVPVEKDEDKSNQGNHEAAMFGGSDTTKFSVATETSSVLEGLTSKTNQVWTTWLIGGAVVDPHSPLPPSTAGLPV